MAAPVLTSGGQVDAQSAVWRDVRADGLLRRRESDSALRSCDCGVAGADRAAGTMVGAEGQDERRRSREEPLWRSRVAAVRRRLISKLRTARRRRGRREVTGVENTPAPRSARRGAGTAVVERACRGACVRRRRACSGTDLG